MCIVVRLRGPEYAHGRKAAPSMYGGYPRYQVNARAVRRQQVVIAQTSKHTHTYPHAHARADIRGLQAAALALHADEPVARAFLLTRLPAAPSATPSVGFLPAHSLGARQTTHTLEPCAMVAVRMLGTLGLFVFWFV